MQTVELTVPRHGAGWAVKHNGGFVGHLHSRAEAIAIARQLGDWVAADGRAAELKIEAASAPPRRFHIARARSRRSADRIVAGSKPEGERTHAQS